MFSLVFKNIKNSFLSYKSIYSLLLVSQIVAIIILLLVYGIITNYNIKIEEKNYEYKFMGAIMDEPVSALEVKELLPEMLGEMEARLSECFLTFSTPESDIMVNSCVSFEDGEYCMPSETFPMDRLAGGRYLTKQELNEGAMVAFGYGDRYEDDQNYVIGDTYLFGGNEYEIVGVVDRMSMIHSICIPINSCTEDMKVKTVQLSFSNLPTVKDFESFEQTMKEHFGSNVRFSEFRIAELDEIVRYNTVILLAVIIGGIAAFDTILVYSYLLKKRKRQMAIFSIEGATRIQKVAMCAIEVLLITIITTLCGVALFELMIEELLVKAYKISMEMYTVKVYLYLIISYIGTIVMGTSVMINFSTRKKVLDIRRR